MQEEKVPKVSVCVITYNQGAFISKAVNSALIQKTNFEYDIIIADDCSTDDTTQILTELRDRYPNKIKLLLRNKNVGAAKNWIELIRYPRSKYIAYLEGDDYWSDTEKLQKQHDALEINSNVSLCFHDVILRNAVDNSQSIFPKTKKNMFYTADVILRPWFCPSGSIMFRSEIVSSIPDDIISVHNGDLALLYFCSIHGPLLRIDDCMGVYNYLAPNSQSLKLRGADDRRKKLINMSSTIGYIRKNASIKYYLYIYIKLTSIKLKAMISFVIFFIHKIRKTF